MSFGRRSLVVLIGVLVALIWTSPSLAQDNDESARPGEGQPSPRTAPTLGPGTYDGSLFAGETLWYQVLVPDGAEIDLSVELLEDNGRTDLELEVAFLQGDLVSSITTERATQAGEQARVEGTASNRGLGSGNTIPWNLRVTLRTDGRIGERLPARMSIAGTAEPTSSEPCGPPCPLEDELEELEGQLAALLDELAAAEAAGTDAQNPERVALETQIAEKNDRLRQLQGEASTLRAESAELGWPVARLAALGAIAAGLLITGLAFRSAASRREISPAIASDETAQHEQMAESPLSLRSTEAAKAKADPDAPPIAVERREELAPEYAAGMVHAPPLSIGVDGVAPVVRNPGQSAVVGRDPSCDLTISDGRVSRRHARFNFVDGAWMVADLGSKRGTFIGGKRVSTKAVSGSTTVQLGDEPDSPALRIEVIG